ncbi:hypothetical protein COW36_10795 [bacterium (Candidatus Blackallbacteria) CG17_big_fil_post_rev_8_21_14_2_50_48_46]|uniref:Peptidase M28 domain-containing protein n=1 Tax=bacterium (Candidatus Blackallbacteria) CG17_big_fil_post_rev_8_21_14_2_50_48_46 TaxID=2014261 RepID=A0A2M7G4U6_9BACT|nr:MAG: hypothetical protein COW64_20525 [bacterium (Candidatus Blackallbacteria) CG18_big_fil_WC_8_21_14_2_50_49_26]PIW16954.1 MAG: hypothetical protein COW36_10795 [bacterium (Candidatus Blackallbacteria) CG17_big_fil_post_rev_8_21_14_2_50_48_46]PIW50233.1 MAG: hypothetical protein COW20_03310 [bacterium (Candidatus Blackallbacteria) CG13_big_fil_rev_8_21_14_2_50_49_14]
MKSKILLAALSLALLNSCNALVSTPQAAPPLRSFALQRKVSEGIEKRVDLKRMESNLAALTGARQIASNTVIPERGTVQGRAMTRQYLKETLEGLGYTVELDEYRRNGSNVFTRLMAEEPSDEYIVVGAHMDSVRNAGADDNASGSTAVLEAAAVLPQLKGRKVNILFAWFDEEELGLVGSSYLARKFKKQGLKITSVHTIDMLGWDGDGDKAVELARPDGILWDYYQMVNKTHGLNLPLDRTNTGQSDHVSFHDQGYPSLCMSEEWTSEDSTPYYHQRGDQFPTINREFLASGAQLMIAAVGDLSLKVPPPANIQRIPHDRFPAREREFHKSYEEALH